jgi:hypothetical protein
VRIQREEKTDYEPVGKVASPTTSHPTQFVAESAIAARLRPMDGNTSIEPLYGTSQPIASVASTQPRNEYQRGMRANELYPNQTPAYGTPLPPVSTGVAGLPLAPVWR